MVLGGTAEVVWKTSDDWISGGGVVLRDRTNNNDQLSTSPIAHPGAPRALDGSDERARGRTPGLYLKDRYSIFRTSRPISFLFMPAALQPAAAAAASRLLLLLAGARAHDCHHGADGFGASTGGVRNLGYRIVPQHYHAARRGMQDWGSGLSGSGEAVDGIDEDASAALADWAPLRVHVRRPPGGFLGTNATAVLDELVDGATGWVEGALRVRPPAAALELPTDPCTTCSECTLLPSDNAAIGYVLFVTVQPTDVCATSGSVAQGTTCVRDQFDRPLVGHVNVCRSALEDASASTATLSNIFTHELVHALGFSAASWPLLRMRDGVTPRTPREVDGLPPSVPTVCADGTVQSLLAISNGTLRHSDTAADAPGVHVHTLVTPRLASVARDLLGCGGLDGVPLENQPATVVSTGRAACVGSHFEQRVFLHEMMASYTLHAYLVCCLGAGGCKRAMEAKKECASCVVDLTLCATRCGNVVRECGAVRTCDSATRETTRV